MAVSLHIKEAHQPLPPALLNPALSDRGFHKKLGGLNQPFAARAWEEKDDSGVTSGSSPAKDRCHTLSSFSKHTEVFWHPIAFSHFPYFSIKISQVRKLQSHSRTVSVMGHTLHVL